MNKTCKHCGKTFRAYPSENRKYCSRECFFNGSIRGIPKTAAQKKKMSAWQFGRGNHQWKGGKYIDKKGTTKETVYILDWSHPSHNCRGYVAEHRYVVEKFLNRLLRTDEAVHHLDGNRLNNDISNLVVMNHDEHTILHHMGKKHNTDKSHAI